MNVENQLKTGERNCIILHTISNIDENTSFAYILFIYYRNKMKNNEATTSTENTCAFILYKKKQKTMALQRNISVFFLVSDSEWKKNVIETHDK